jgi:hypothetical protein
MGEIGNTRLLRALSTYHQREQFHKHKLLDEIIAAVREEEQAKFPALVHMAKAIAIQGLREDTK